jgi:hypothetical protein
MRIRDTIVAAGFSVFATALLAPREAAAQIAPIAPRDPTWTTLSNVTMVINAGLVTLMPRIYYNDPEATVGWKARWHISVLAPALSLTALTLLVDGPIRNAIQSPRPGCGSIADLTAESFPNSGCQSYGMPSTQSFAAWGATGAGTSIFLVDKFKYSGSRFNAGSFVGNVGVPLVLSVLTSVGRGVAGNGYLPAESAPQVIVGTLSGLVTGALLGLGYSFMQRPNCGYGGNVVCW